jgi:hypothetical protein
VIARSTKSTGQYSGAIKGHNISVDKAGISSFWRCSKLRKRAVAVQLLLGQTQIESTVRYLGIEVDDALVIAEEVDF